jgi:hypothetical protein
MLNEERDTVVSWTPGPRPKWVEVFNQGRSKRLADIARKPLDAETLMAEAKGNTGLSDFGEDAFREPLELLLYSMEKEARLNLLGRYQIRKMVVRLLENRLKIAETLRKDPGIPEEVLSRPIFITGMPRTGTSILHEVMAEDPAFRPALTWELWYPAPPPEPATHETDPRIGMTHRDVTRWGRIVPAYRIQHPQAATLPHECPYLWSHEFMSEYFSACFNIPSYTAWLGKPSASREEFHRPYRMQRLLLQLLQRRYPTKQWLLKAPSHQGHLPSLFDIFPDARVIITHRDPLKVLGSVISLVASLHWMATDDVDYQGIIDTWGYMPGLLNEVIDWRASGRIPDKQIYDFRYADFAADPIAAIADVYRYFDMPFTSEAESRMRAYLKARNQERGVHRYSFEELGMDKAEQRQRFARYQERYQVPNEI